MFLDPSLHFLAAQGEIAKIKEEIDKGVSNFNKHFSKSLIIIDVDYFELCFEMERHGS